jgi:hypothetical protein
VLHIGHQKRQEGPNRQAEQYAKRERVKFLCKKANRNSGDNALYGRADHNSNEFGSNGRSKPSSQSIDRSQHGAKYHTNE